MSTNPYIPILVVSVLVEVWLFHFAWRRRSYSVAFYFCLVMACLLVWSLGFIVELSSLHLKGALFWANVQFLGITFLPLAWLAMVADYTGHWQHWRSFLRWFLAIPIMTNLVIWTNPRHHLFRGTPFLDSSGPFPLLNNDYGLWFYFPLATFAYLAFGLGFLLLIQHYRSDKPIFRRQVFALFISSLLPLAVDLAYTTGFSPIANFNFALPTFAVTGIYLAGALFSFQIFDVNPVARNLLVERMQDGLLVLDDNHRLLDINPAARYALDPQGRWRIGQPAQREFLRFPQLIDELYAVNETHTELALDIGNKRIYVDLQILPLLNDQKRFVGRLFVWRDISEHKRLEEKLEERVAQRTAELAAANDHLQELDRLKDEFIARIGHELRTPLTNIQLYLHLLEKARPEKFPMYMQTLGSEANQLQRLIEDLLNIFQISTDEAPIDLAPVEVNTLVVALIESQKQRADQIGSALSAQIDANLPQAQAHKTMLWEVLNHLMDNALNYAPKSTITVRTYVDHNPDQPWVCIQVQDTGPGVAESERAYLFDRFYRGQAASSYEIPGAGLGLSICRLLMQRMGGEITLDDSTEQGAAFTARLHPTLIAPSIASPITVHAPQHRS